MKIVEIHWLDAMSGADTWADPASMDDFSNYMETVGFLVSETDDAYVVASSRCCETEQIFAPIKIPKISVLDYWEILFR